MMLRPRDRMLLLSSAALMLAACTPGSSVREDETGDLGALRSESPADVYANLGLAYMQEGQLAVAMRKLKHGLEVDPKNARVHNILALLYERLGEHAQAESHFREAASLAPKDPYIRNAWGSFLCQRGELERADEEFRKALQNPLYETPWVALTNAGVCARRGGDLTKAESYLRSALTANAGFVPALGQMAQVSFQQQNWLSARAYIQRYRTAATPTAEILWLGIRAERQLGDRTAAARYEEELRERYPDAPEVQLMRESRQP